MAESEEEIIYPPGVKDLAEDISTDDLIRRLRECAQAFQSMSQEEESPHQYEPLAHFLVSERFLEHGSPDVRLLVACCVADVFRIFAPDAPYEDEAQIKMLLEFFIDHLEGLSDTQSPSFKRHFYLLENLSVVKTFNICMEIPETQAIICRLFDVMFKVIKSNMKIKRFIVDLLTPFCDSDYINQDLLDILLMHIVEPYKSQNVNGYLLAREIIQKSATNLEPFLTATFNAELVLGVSERKSAKYFTSRHLFDLIYELNIIYPSIIFKVLPELANKLRNCNNEIERMDVTKLAARILANKNSNLIENDNILWKEFLQRFYDKEICVREFCAKSIKTFLLIHPESKDDITNALITTHRDVSEHIRYTVIASILAAAKEDIFSINEQLLDYVQDRMLDKKYEVRKEAILGLGKLFNKYVLSEKYGNDNKLIKMLDLSKSGLLNIYYQPFSEDRILVERILYTCLVPYQKPKEERMKLLYKLYCTVDGNASRAIKEIFKLQRSLRNAILNIMEIIQQNNDDQTKLIETKIRSIAKHLPSPVKAIGILMQFSQHLKKDVQLRSKLSIILNGNVTCEVAESGVKQILKHFGNPVESNQYYMLLKQLLERIVPIMLDKEGLKFLISFVEDSEFSGTIDAELNIKKSTRKALDLILILSYAFPQYFCDDYIYSTFLKLLHSEDDIVAEKTLKIFCNITNEPGLDKNQMCNTLNHHMLRFIESGTPKQVKHALYCLAHVVKNREEVFGNILHKLKRHFTLESPHFRAALVAVGHIAFMCQNMFACELKTIVAKVVVKDLLMLEKNLPYKGNELWVPFDSLPNETKVKLEGMKVMVRWLLGLKDVIKPAMSTFRLLNTIIEHRGDLMERGHNAPMENSWMRVTAAGCLLRLCREPNYSESLTLQQFQRLAYVITDECFEVRNIFVEKLNKGLHFMKLPLEFLAIYALGGLEPDATLKDNIKKNLACNIKKRRDLISNGTLSPNNEPLHLPDYALQYAVHLLAHAPFLREYNNVPSLLKVQKCLSFFLETLILKNIGYSFSFFKRLLEDIKQTKDKQDPENAEVNLKLYAVSDLALNILMSQHKLILKDFPARPKLNPRFFTDPDPNYSNLETYLPAKLLNLKSLKKAGFDIQVFNTSENEPSTSTMNKKTKATSRNSKASVKKLPPEKNTKYSMAYQSNSEPETNSLHSASDLSDVESSVDSGNEEYPSSVRTRTRTRNNKTIKQKKVPSLKKKQLSKSPLIKRSSKNNYLSNKRSKKLSPDSNLTEYDDNLSSSVSIISIDASCPSNYQHLIKECTVELDKIELKEHTSKVLNVAKNHLVSNKRKQSDFKSEDDLSDQDSSSNIHNGKLTKKGRSNKKNSSLKSLNKKGKQSTSKDEENNNVPKLPAKSVKNKQTIESPKRTLRNKKPTVKGGNEKKSERKLPTKSTRNKQLNGKPKKN